MTAKIESINNNGGTRIRFSQKMRSEHLNISDINSTMLDIYVRPSQDWHKDDESFDSNSTLNFTWVVERYEEDFLDLSLNFTNPLKISPNLIRDLLVVSIKNNSEFFIS